MKTDLLEAKHKVRSRRPRQVRASRMRERYPELQVLLGRARNEAIAATRKGGRSAAALFEAMTLVLDSLKSDLRRKNIRDLLALSR